ncbi:high mobility group box domain-containing protein, partial [Syncephalis pseudoplumigaleata]
KNMAIIRDPARPKRPMSAFFHYLTGRREELRRNSDIALTEVAKQVAEEWKGLSEAEKKPYVDRAAKEYEAYIVKNNAYRATIPKPINLSNALKPAKKPKKKVAKKPAKKKVVKKKKPAKKVVKK